MNNSEHRWAMPSAILLSVIALLLAVDLSLRVADRVHYRQIADEALETIHGMQTQRIQVFSDYLKDLESYETKSVYHQIYHASNAQLKMADLIAQENQLLVTLLAGKR